MSRTILVTGASSGIGRAVSQQLLKADYSVLGVAREFARFKTRNSAFTRYEIDLADLANLTSHLSEIASAHSEINGLVLCAGRGQFGSLEEFSHKQIRELIDINLTSQISLVREFLPLMKRGGQGDIIIMGSEAALSGGKRGAVYSSTKFALRGFAQALRQECSSSNIRVCIINPGTVHTDFFNALNFKPGDSSENYILPEDVAVTVQAILEMRQGTVVDEINMSPQKKVLKFNKSQSNGSSE